MEKMEKMDMYGFGKEGCNLREGCDLREGWDWSFEGWDG